MTSLRQTAESNRPTQAKATGWKWALAAGLLALIGHLPAAGNGFTNWDDTAYIHNNPHMTAPDGLKRIWTTGESPQYYPLTFSSFWIEYRLWRTDPRGYHLVNIAFHAINAGLVVVLMMALGMSARAALAVAILFALSPIQVMSVAWVAERKNVLSTLFGLIALICWARLFRRGGWGNYWVALFAFILALLSKSAWLVLPVVAGLLGVLVFKQRLRRVGLLMIPWLILSGVCAGITLNMEQQFKGETYPLIERMLVAPGALLFYVCKTLLPVGLYPYYPRWDASCTRIISWIPAAMVLLGAVAVVRYRNRLGSRVLWGIWTFVIFLLPVLGLIPFANMDLTWVSDHFVYYASIGLYGAVVAGAGRIIRNRTVAGVVLVILTVGLTAMTWRQIPVWQDARSMWSRALQRNPDSHVAYAGLGLAYLGEKNYSEATEHFHQALKLKPDDAKIRSDLGWALIQMGRFDEAERQFQTVLEFNPQVSSAHLQLGLLAQHRGDLPSAVIRLQTALRIDSDYEDAAIYLVKALIQNRQLDEARKVLEGALENHPRSERLRRELASLAE